MAQEDAFIEADGLVVIEAESISGIDGWLTETSESGYAGNGYLRWNGANFFTDPGNGTIAYKVRIDTPGEYNMRLRLSHQGAPAGDQENDCWTRMDGGEWIKTFHPSNRIDEGFTFHSFHEPSSGEFVNPRYTLSAGEHIFYISGRSKNVRIDRIHLYLDSVADPLSIAHPESARGVTGGGGGGDATPGGVTVTGEQKKWHPITITLDGPQASEGGNPNPFLDYRFEVTFTQGASSYRVPGYFAADGNAAETGATAGNKWRAHFVPERTGTWTYTISMRSGADVALDTAPTAGSATAFNGLSGSFTISETDKTGADFRGKGMLRYVGRHYLQFDNGEYFIKGGADSPENFLAYKEFDGTVNGGGTDFTKSYNAHVGDWQPGDPTWKGSKGKGIIGALNYLASKGMNSVYFLTMNVDGDGKDVWPWPAQGDRLVYDVSKLAQWDIVFNHMDRLGIMLHVQTQETENELLLNGGNLGRERKLYYRELVARFGYHHAITWNLGEENDDNTTAQRKQFADYFAALDPYDHPVVVHTVPGQYDQIYNPLLGYPTFDGPSLQIKSPELVHAEVKKWRTLSAASRRWIVSLDEIGPYNLGVTPDGSNNNHGVIRKQALWGTLMAGGAGVEWYFGYDYDNHDLSAEDFRTRDEMWDFTRYALEFFQAYLPFNEMNPMDEVTSRADDYVFAKPGEAYAIYLPSGGTATANLAGGEYSVRWYNPRSGGALQTGSVQTVNGSGSTAIGNPPGSVDSDWVALLRSTSGVMTQPELRVTPATLNFGEVQAGTPKTLPLTVINDGNASLSISSLSIGGDNPFPFTVPEDPAPFTLNPGASIVLNVVFEPGAAGSKDASLRIASNDPNRSLLNVTLSGSGVAAGSGGGTGDGGDGGGTGGGGTGGGGGSTGGGGSGGGTGGGTGGGEAGNGIRVVSFTLVDAQSGEELMTIHNGDIINLGSLPTANLNIRADTEPEQVGSVQFSLNENRNFRLENSLPYAMAGDIGDTYNAWTPVPGEHVLKASPYSSRNATGALGESLEITFVVSRDGELPGAIELNQNFPNPFHERTTIAFKVQKTAYVTLDVYNAMGQRVQRIVDRYMPDGVHHVIFDGADLSSGLYLYRIESEGQVTVGKMLLVR
ncbi:MAG: choice-of-anchor D domain-containing protein [Rhodothermales bacterium]